MSFFQVQGEPTDISFLGDLPYPNSPEDSNCIEWYDGPVLFISKSITNELLIVLQNDDDREQKIARYFVIPALSIDVNYLRYGDKYAIRHLMNIAPFFYVVDQEYDGKIKQAWKTKIDQVPREELPFPDSLVPSKEFNDKVKVLAKRLKKQLDKI